jgi:hypothetical protein
VELATPHGMASEAFRKIFCSAYTFLAHLSSPFAHRYLKFFLWKLFEKLFGSKIEQGDLNANVIQRRSSSDLQSHFLTDNLCFLENRLNGL